MRPVPEAWPDNGTLNWGGFRDYYAMPFDISHYNGSSLSTTSTYTVGLGETLVKDTFALSADNED